MLNLNVNLDIDIDIDIDIDHKDLELVDPKLLPPQIRFYINTIGLPNTLKLLQSKGGTFLRVPLSPSGSELEKIIGFDSANKLCEVIGGEIKELPKADKILMQLRDRAINEARKTMSASQAALKFNLTRRHIINLTNKDPENPNGDLFI